MIIDGAVIRNDSTTCDLIIENKVTLLREKDIMSEKGACTPCTRIYFCIQLMYIDRINLNAHHDAYWELVRDLVAAAPSFLPLVDQISDAVQSENYYQALKIARRLIDYEEEIIQNECNKRVSGIRASEHGNPYRPGGRGYCSYQSSRETQAVSGQLAS